MSGKSRWRARPSHSRSRVARTLRAAGCRPGPRVCWRRAVWLPGPSVVGVVREGSSGLDGVRRGARCRAVRGPGAVAVAAGFVRGVPGVWPGRGAAGGRDVGAAHEHPGESVSVGGRGGVCHRGAVHLPAGHHGLRRSGPAAAGQPGGTTPAETTRDDQVSGAGFARLLMLGLAGLRPDGTGDEAYRGRELARNAAVGRLALATGLRRQEFTFLLAVEIPALPARRAQMPIPFPVPAGVTKGRKFRTTWVSCEALAGVHGYLRLGRPLACEGSRWRPPAAWGEPLLVEQADAVGGLVNGRRVRWAVLRPLERRRLVAADGGSMLLAVRGDGGPFTAWASVLHRTAERIRQRFEPRFPQVWPHRLRHSFAMRTLELLVSGYYAQAAALVRDTDAEPLLFSTWARPRG